uniref:Rabaptin, RAB GTPase binding effector protein 1 n=1 Tax=Neogobius melanostomus TaxID=47308 RepID=A0A8C6U886_9GOBI
MAEEASGPPLSSHHGDEPGPDRAELTRLKLQLEAEFNQKRAKFKELYLSKEEELKRQTVALESAQLQLSSMQAQLEQARAEMDTIRAVATVSENTKQEAIDAVRSQWQEEVASLQAIMKDTVREYELQFHQRLEQERAQWGQYREAMEREVGDLRRRLNGGQEEDNLEDEMKKAQEDAEKLRSVVMPMEREIAALKTKLGSSEERVKELEASKVKELNHVLEAEKSCRTDLEMYVAVLNTQKSVLQEDAEKLRRELHEVCHKLELERQQHNQLKHTWQRANDQFLESQRLLMRDMQLIESVLSSEQLRQVEEMKKKDQVQTPVFPLPLYRQGGPSRHQRPPPSQDDSLLLCSAHVNHSAHGSLHSLDTEGAVSPMDPYRDSLRRVQSTDSLGSAPSPQQGLGHNHKAKSAGHLEESDFGPLVGADGVADSALGDAASLNSIKLTASHFLLTKDQEKAIKAMTPEQEETASLLSSISQAPDTAFLPAAGYRLVSDSEWSLLQQELKNAGRKLGRRCELCSNYEKQLQAIQGQEADTRDQVKKLHQMLRQANEVLEQTMKEKQNLEDSVKVGNEETTAKVAALMQRVQESEALLVSLQSAFTEAKRSTQEQMKALVGSREQLVEELSRLHRDNENLLGKQRLHNELQQQEEFTLPRTSLYELQTLVLRLREDLVVVRGVGRAPGGEAKGGDPVPEEQIQAEQCLKENLEETLQLEIEGYKEELASFSSLKTEVERLKWRGSSQVLDEKDKAQRLQTELDVSEQVQKDFVKLSQTLQVKRNKFSLMLNNSGKLNSSPSVKPLPES